MIYNRTATDVSLAKRLRAEKVQKFIELTDDEVQTLERGTITINTLNRIEDKQAEIKAMLDDMGYLNPPVIYSIKGGFLRIERFSQKCYSKILL